LPSYVMSAFGDKRDMGERKMIAATK